VVLPDVRRQHYRVRKAFVLWAIDGTYNAVKYQHYCAVVVHEAVSKNRTVWFYQMYVGSSRVRP
jgi:fructose-1,6-bisphosphatase/inositol monophosphatase family enzyme